MIQFNRDYTYGDGRYLYRVVFVDGKVLVVANGTILLGEKAVRFHLFEVTTQDSFRYIK